MELYPLHNYCPGHSSPCGPGLVSPSPQNSVFLAVYRRGWDDGLQGPPLLLPLTLQAASGPVELAAAHSLMMSAEQAVGSPAPVPLLINSSPGKQGPPSPKGSSGWPVALSAWRAKEGVSGLSGSPGPGNNPLAHPGEKNGRSLKSLPWAGPAAATQSSMAPERK